MRTAPRLTIAAFVVATFNLSAATLYVSLESTNPTAPFATWATAATNIQDAVDAAQAGDAVLVTNGVYALGGRAVSVFDTIQEPPELLSTGPSRVAVTNAITLQSVNGPSLTTIEGEQLLDESGVVTNGVRCVSLAANAVLKDKNMGDRSGGRRPLHYAAANGSAEVVRILREARADVDAPAKRVERLVRKNVNEQQPAPIRVSFYNRCWAPTSAIRCSRSIVRSPPPPPLYMCIMAPSCWRSCPRIAGIRPSSC